MKNVLNKATTIVKTGFDLTADQANEIGVEKYVVIELVGIGAQVLAEVALRKAITKRYPKTARALGVLTKVGTVGSIALVMAVAAKAKANQR